MAICKAKKKHSICNQPPGQRNILDSSSSNSRFPKSSSCNLDKKSEGFDSFFSIPRQFPFLALRKFE